MVGLAAACEPYEGVLKIADLPNEYRLTVEEPVIALEVTVCIRGDTPPNFEIKGSFRAGFRTDEGEVTATIENLASGQRETLGADADIYEYAAVEFALVADWSGSGRRCSAPEILEISVADLASGQEVTVLNPEGRVSVSGSDPGLCGGVLDHDEVSIDIERL